MRRLHTSQESEVCAEIAQALMAAIRRGLRVAAVGRVRAVDISCGVIVMRMRFGQPRFAGCRRRRESKLSGGLLRMRMPEHMRPVVHQPAGLGDLQGQHRQPGEDQGGQ